MKLEELALLAKDVRDKQRAYFKTRDSEALQASKEAERKLDRAVAEILDGSTLFGDEK